MASGPPPPPPLPPRRRRLVWRAIGVSLACSLGATVIAANFVRVPYVIISPGEATALDDSVVSISGSPTYHHKGKVLFLTVRVTNRDPTLWRYLFSQLDGDVSVEPREDVIGGCATYEETGRLNDLLMEESQDIAKTVALERLGFPVVTGATRVVIVQVVCGGPSDGRLMLGDVITAIDGQPVTTAEQVGPLIQVHHQGENVRVTVDRGGKSVDVSVRASRVPRSLDPERHRSGAPYLGIASRNVTDEQFPLDIKIDTQRVSGPSAGLAFTLAIIDDLTPGDLTGGRKVAVTGSILPGGGVARVGGVAQKAITARTNGATLMLVPAGEGKEAREHADGMRVVVVKTADDALAALERFGGDPIPARAAEQTGQ